MVLRRYALAQLSSCDSAPTPGNPVSEELVLLGADDRVGIGELGSQSKELLFALDGAA